MQIKTLLTFLRWPHALTQLRLARDLDPFLRLHFLYAASELGLLAELHKEPASPSALAKRIKAARPDFLALLLELGVATGELAMHAGRYSLRGQRARALGQPSGDALVALVQECIAYHGSVYRHLAERIKGAPLGDYLADKGALIARSSRTLEPLMQNFVTDTVARRRPARLLEIGCGSGVYLKYAATAYPPLRGMGIDLDQSVVQQARNNLVAWGIAERFTVMPADIRHAPEALAGPFDFISLYNNLYYFTPEERPALFRQLHSRLAPGGTFAVVSLMRGKSAMTINFDLVLRSTVGCAALPAPEETMAQLKAAGFTAIEPVPLMPAADFHGILARRQG
ncbi:MAG: methyltransferase domain-containing protein [Thermodesulfobacteriota bacterium]